MYLTKQTKQKCAAKNTYESYVDNKIQRYPQTKAGKIYFHTCFTEILMESLQTGKDINE